MSKTSTTEAATTERRTPRAFDPEAPSAGTRRKEQVELTDGYLWIWELTAGDSLFVVERSIRPRTAGGPEMMTGDALLWRTIVSCYDSDQPDARRVFELKHLPRLQALKVSDWNRLQAAIDRVNGLEAEEVPRLRDFTAAPPAEAPPS